MNYNILAYSIFALITIYIILWVGRLFHKNGRIFILSLFHKNEQLADTTNNLLLIGYYLFNIGYAVIQLSYWKTIITRNELLSSIATKIGTLVLLLATMHYINMFIIYQLSKNKTNSLPIKQ
jgi:hypothetical protein